MLRFNVIGYGYLEYEGRVGLKKSNDHWRFCDLELGRSFEFEVPETESNRVALGFCDLPESDGEAMRRSLECQLTYDGGSVMGTMAVESYSDGLFHCVFYFGDFSEISDVKLSEINFEGLYSLVWEQSTPVYDAAQAVSEIGQGNVGLIRYERPENHFCNLFPSTSLTGFANAVAAHFGRQIMTDISPRYWLVFTTMNGVGEQTVTLTMSAINSGRSSESSLFTVENIQLKSAAEIVFASYIGGTTTNAKGFKAMANMKVKVDDAPSDIYLVRYGGSIATYSPINHDRKTGAASPLTGSTFELKKGCVYFFATKHPRTKSPHYGFEASDIPTPYAVSLTSTQVGNIDSGDKWSVANNIPDMTCFEFLKSVALATGRELSIDETLIRLTVPVYGQEFLPITGKVVSAKEVRRSVDAWGVGNKTSRVVFDSDEDVVDPIETAYDIDNDNLDGVADHVARFSEGVQGNAGLFIKDMSDERDYEVYPKKPIIAYAEEGEKYLQRVAAPEIVAYSDIASGSTMVMVDVVADESVFFELKPSTTILWRGMAYLWTDVQWSDGVLSLTMQKVSQQL